MFASMRPGTGQAPSARSNSSKSQIPSQRSLSSSLSPVTTIVVFVSTLCFLVNSLSVCHGSTLAPYELEKQQSSREEPMAPEPSRVRIVTNTDPIVSKTPLDEEYQEGSSPSGLLDRFTRFRESLQRERLRDLQENFMERIDNIRSHAGLMPDKVYKVDIDLPLSKANGRPHGLEQDHRLAEASSPQHEQQQVITSDQRAADLNQMVRYDDNLQDGESSRRRSYTAPFDLASNEYQPAAYPARQSEFLASSLADSLFGYYPAQHYRVARSVPLEPPEASPMAPMRSQGLAYDSIGSSPMVAHESPSMMAMNEQLGAGPDQMDRPGGMPEQASPHTQRARHAPQQHPNQDNLVSDSVWPHAGDPFEASGPSGFGQRASGMKQRMRPLAGDRPPSAPASEMDEAGQFVQDQLNKAQAEEGRADMPEPMQHQQREQHNQQDDGGQLIAPPSLASGAADQIKLASTEGYGADQYAMKSDESGCDEEEEQHEYKPAKKSKKAYKHKQEAEEEEHYEPPPPPKKVIVKKEEKHHHYHHHHHHHPEPKKQMEQSYKKPEKAHAQTQPLHLEIHIKGKGKAKSKSKGKKGKDKEKAKGKEGDEIYVKLNQGAGSGAGGYGHSEGYGGGGGGGGSEGYGGGGDEGSYVDGKSGSAGTGELVDDKKSLIEESDEGYKGENDGKAEKEITQKVPVKHNKKKKSRGDEGEEEKREEEKQEEGSDTAPSSNTGEQEQQAADGESKSDSDVERTEQKASHGGGGDVINSSQMPDFGHFETFFEERPHKELHKEEEKGGAGGEGKSEGASGGEGEHHKHKKEHKKHEKKKEKHEHKKEEKKEEEVKVEEKPVEHEKKEEKKVEPLPEVKKEEHKKVSEPVVEQKEQPKKEEKHEEKKKVHKSKHAHIEVHQHKHFEHHQHINLPPETPELEHDPEHQQQHHQGGEHEVMGEQPIHEDHHGGGGGGGGGGEHEHMPVDFEHQHQVPMMNHHHQQPVEPEHHMPIKEHWIAPDIQEKPPSKQHPHGAFIIEDHSELDKHGYEHPSSHGIQYREEVINHPHGFGLTPVAAYNLMGAYSTQTTSHSSTSEGKSGNTNKRQQKQQVNESQETSAREKPSRQ